MRPKPPRDEPHLVITVTRTGGFAGIARTWHAEAPPAAYAPLSRLVAACPWEDDPPGVRGRADGFTFLVDVVDGPTTKSQTLPEQAVTGAWENLIDAVRAAPH